MVFFFQRWVLKALMYPRVAFELWDTAGGYCETKSNNTSIVYVLLGAQVIFQRSKKDFYLNRNKESGVVGNGVFVQSQLFYQMHGLLAVTFYF